MNIIYILHIVLGYYIGSQLGVMIKGFVSLF